jgi:hypothetical protein
VVDASWETRRCGRPTISSTFAQRPRGGASTCAFSERNKPPGGPLTRLTGAFLLAWCAMPSSPPLNWLDDDAHATTRSCRNLYSRRLTISFLSSAIALAGFSPFGHAFVQFKIVWQR